MGNVLLRSVQGDIHSSWNEFLTPDILNELNLITNILYENGKIETTPPEHLVLRFLTVNLHQVKILILGQDPYPQKGVATGRSFEVGTLKSWNEKFRNVSLKNIVRSIHYAYNGEYLNYKEAVQKTDILPPDQLFENWEKQGVLLLNTSFTCKIGVPGSHAGIWKSFTQRLLEFINNSKPGLIWFLWGSHAKRAVSHLSIKNAYHCQHPMICYRDEKRKDDFLFGEANMFRETNSLIRWRGDTNPAT